jgi:hypothetical protein
MDHFVRQWEKQHLYHSFRKLENHQVHKFSFLGLYLIGRITWPFFFRSLPFLSARNAFQHDLLSPLDSIVMDWNSEASFWIQMRQCYCKFQTMLKRLGSFL